MRKNKIIEKGKRVAKPSSRKKPGLLGNFLKIEILHLLAQLPLKKNIYILLYIYILLKKKKKKKDSSNWGKPVSFHMRQ